MRVLIGIYYQRLRQREEKEREIFVTNVRQLQQIISIFDSLISLTVVNIDVEYVISINYATTIPLLVQ